LQNKEYNNSPSLTEKEWRMTDEEKVELFNSMMPERLHIGSVAYEKIKCTCGMDDRVDCEVHKD